MNFREFILFEALQDRIQLLIKKYPHVSPDTIQQTINYDPSGGKYLDWIISRINSGNIKWPNDADKVKKVLSTFDEIKKKPILMKQYQVNPDIFKYSLQNLEEISNKKSTITQAVDGKQTVAQYLKSGNIPKDIVKIAQDSAIESFNLFIKPYANATEKLEAVLPNWVAYNAIKELIRKLYLTKDEKGYEVLKSHIVAFVKNLFANCWRDARDYILSKFHDKKFLSKLDNMGYAPINLSNDNHVWHEELKLQKSVPGAPGEAIIKLDDVGMPGWTWVSLGRGYCSIESMAMGHCGGSDRSGDNLISLRDPKQKAYLTFSVNNKVLGEAKGKYNEKPTQQYHKAITKLLLSPYVDSIRGGGYKPESNFHFDDLTTEEQALILKKKPHMANYADYAFKTVNEETIKDLMNTDIVGINGQTVILEKCETYKELYYAIKNSDVEGFSWLDDPEPMDFSFGDNEIRDAIEYLSKKELRDITFMLNNEGIDPDEEGQDDLDVIIIHAESDVANDIKTAIENAFHHALEAGYQTAVYKDLVYDLSSATHNGFWVDFKNGMKIEISVSSLKQLYVEHKDEFDGGENISTYYDFSYKFSDNYDGFSEESFHETLGDELYQLLKTYGHKKQPDVHPDQKELF